MKTPGFMDYFNVILESLEMPDRAIAIVKNDKSIQKLSLSDDQINELAELDPTPYKKYTPWLIKMVYMHKQKVCNDLEFAFTVFDELRLSKSKSLKHTDIYRYKNIQDFVDDVIEANDKNSLHKVRRYINKSSDEFDPQKAEDGLNIIYNDSEFTIYEPTNSHAHVKLCRNTNLCHNTHKNAEQANGWKYIFRNRKMFLMLHEFPEFGEIFAVNPGHEMATMRQREKLKELWPHMKMKIPYEKIKHWTTSPWGADGVTVGDE